WETDAAAVRQRARIAMWSLNGLLLFLLGLLLWRALGLPWAAAALALLALDPTVAAHLPVVMTDLPLALTLGIAAVASALLASSWRWRWALAAGAGIGLALAAKHSALAGLAGLALLLGGAALAGWRRGGWRETLLRGARVAVAGALGLALLWASYGFRFHAGPDGSDAFNRQMADKVADLALPHWRDGIAFADRWQLLPRPWLWGLADTVRAGIEGRGASLHLVAGSWYEGDAPWFTWPLVVASKVPLAVLALALCGSVLLLLGRRRGAAMTPAARWTLAAVGAAALLHYATLLGAQGT